MRIAKEFIAAVFAQAKATCWMLVDLFATKTGRYIRTGLSPGYYDKDELLLFSAFSLLVDFVENEVPSVYTNPEAKGLESSREVLSRIIKQSPLDSPDEVASWIEISDLYEWWTKVRPNRKSCYDELYSYLLDQSAKGRRNLTVDVDSNLEAIDMKAYEQERRYEEEDNQMLLRLVKIRLFMWT